MTKENDIRKNGSGYTDVTAYKAIKRASKYETNFSEQLKYIMKYEGLSVCEVANMSGFPVDIINRYLSAELIPTIKDAELILESLGYSLMIDKLVDDKFLRTSSEERIRKLMSAIFSICELSGFHLEERIVVKDLRNGRIWR